MGKLVAAGVRQQVQHAYFTVKIPPATDFPGGSPALGGFRLVLGGNHPGTVGDQMLLLAGIKTMVGGLARTDPQCQPGPRIFLPNPACSRRPQNVPSGLAHEAAYFACVLRV